MRLFFTSLLIYLLMVQIGNAVPLGAAFNVGAAIVTGGLGIAAPAFVLTAVGFVAIAGAAIGLASLAAVDTGGFNPGEFKATFDNPEGTRSKGGGASTPWWTLLLS